MRILIVAVTLTLAMTCPAASQQPSSTDSLRRVTGVSGRMQFDVPASWVVLVERDGDSLAQFAYYIRKPVIDTTADVSTNVIINVRRRLASWSFRSATDAWLSRLLDSSTIVLHDTIIASSQRAVFWRAKDGPWVYLGFDDFARVNDRLLHVRIAEPLSGNTSPDWGRTFETQTLTLLQSIVVDGRRAFPAPVGYPAIVPGPGPPSRTSRLGSIPFP
jgi:hypothetical protein